MVTTATVRRVRSGAPWETKIGYCRAVRTGPFVAVAGTAPVAEGGGVHAPGDARAQTERCIAIATKALRELGASLADVVRTRLYVTDISRWAEYGAAHAAAFGEHPPASTMVEVKALVDPAMLVEIEIDAIVGATAGPAG